MKLTLDPELAREAKALVALAFRNGPIEDLQAGRSCPACSGDAGVSQISDDEMKNLNEVGGQRPLPALVAAGVRSRGLQRETNAGPALHLALG